MKYIKHKRYKRWTQHEILCLKKLKDQNIYTWDQIAKIMNTRYSSFRKTPKQCRDKYENYIKFGNQKQTTKNLSTQDQQNLYASIVKYGLSWIKVRQNLPIGIYLHKVGCNTLKNYYYTSLKMYVYATNKILKQHNMNDEHHLNFIDFRRFIGLAIRQNDRIIINQLYELAMRVVRISLKRDIKINIDEATQICLKVKEFNEEFKDIKNKVLVRKSMKTDQLMQGLKKKYEDKNSQIQKPPLDMKIDIKIEDKIDVVQDEKPKIPKQMYRRFCCKF